MTPAEFLIVGLLVEAGRDAVDRVLFARSVGVKRSRALATAEQINRGLECSHAIAQVKNTLRAEAAWLCGAQGWAGPQRSRNPAASCACCDGRGFTEHRMGGFSRPVELYRSPCRGCAP